MKTEEWVDCTVGEIAAREKNALVGGPFGSDLVSKDYVSFGVPVIRGENLTVGRCVGGDFVFVTADKATKLSANLARPGDLVFTQRGNTVLTGGQVAIVPDNPFDRYLVSQSQMKLTVNGSRADALFLYYAFRAPNHQEYLRCHAIQTGVPHTNLGILRDTPLRLPPLDAQKRIAAILGSLDDKIDLNRRMNETLEAMARGIFKSWFVDFDPVRAKMEGRQPVGIDAETAHLFPESFEESLLGLIPSGWRPCSWGDVITLEYGKSLRGYEKVQGDYTVFGTNGAIGRNDEALCQHPGIIVGRKGAYRGVHFHDEPFFVIDTAYYVEPKKPLELRWAYYQMLREDINGMDSGSAIPSTSRDQFYKVGLTYPPFPIQRRFVELLSPLWLRQRLNSQESFTLSAVRDVLLPKLLSGEIRVEHAERMIEGGM